MKDFECEKKDCGDRYKKGDRYRSRDKKCKDEKICFGHWGEPRDPKCPFPCKYEECNFDEIPNGSIYFAEHWDLYGAVRSLAAKQRYSLIGIVLQLCDGKKKETKKPYVLTVMYDQRVKMYPLCQLVNDPLIMSQLVRPKFRACNKCVDREQDEHLVKLARHYLGAPFEENSPQVARSIFDIPASNPNTCSYTDTELVYRILFEAGLLGDCCPKDEPKKQCLQKCKPDCDQSSDSCECKSKKPCDKTCCGSSSSSAECPPCNKVDCYRASSVSICDFFTADNLDLRWFAAPVGVYTACLDACKRTEAIDNAFAHQKNKVVGNIRDLVGCWLSGDSMAYWKGNSCSPCGRRSSFCGKEISDDSSHREKRKCGKEHADPCNKRCDSVLCRNAETAMLTLLQVVGQLINTETPGSPQTYRVVDGNLMVAYFQAVLDFLASICEADCVKLNYSPKSTSYVYYVVGSLVQQNSVSPLQGFSVDCDENICDGAQRAIITLKTVVDQLVMPTMTGSAETPRQIQGDLMVVYFQAVLDYLASLCGKKALRLQYSPLTTQYVTYTVSPLTSPFAPEPKCGPCKGVKVDLNDYELYQQLVSQMGNNI